MKRKIFVVVAILLTIIVCVFGTSDYKVLADSIPEMEVESDDDVQSEDNSKSEDEKEILDNTDDNEAKTEEKDDSKIQNIVIEKTETEEIQNEVLDISETNQNKDDVLDKDESNSKLLNNDDNLDFISVDEEHFPDEDFRYVIQCCVDTSKDGKLSREELLTVTDFKDLYVVLSEKYGTTDHKNRIKDLSGIEYFTNLEELSIGDLAIENIDLSSNTKLEKLWISNTNIRQIDLSHNKDLKLLSCYNTKLSSIDLSNNLKLEELDIDGAIFGNVTCDVGNIKALALYGGQITNLNLDSFTNLEYLGAFDCQLGSINLCNCRQLKSLYINNCGLSSIDISKTSIDRISLINSINEIEHKYNTLIGLVCDNNINVITNHKNEWAFYYDKWYYFDVNGYMTKNEYRGGCWLREDGSWNGKTGAKWVNGTQGWWYNDNGWYPKNQWLKIDGKDYYFDVNGYMAKNEYRGGCWLRGDGSWNGKTGAKWVNGTQGWWYNDNGWYPKNQWLKIDGKDYYFDVNGYMAKNEYRGGCWLRGDGSWNGKTGAKWVNETQGWWYNDNGWYPKNQWLKIDGKDYYFDVNGYMAKNEYRGGCWLRGDGSWNGKTGAKWVNGTQGWWYNDNGWYPKNQWLKIDGKDYYFDVNGYMAKNEYRGGCWLREDGSWNGKTGAKWVNGTQGWWYNDNGWYPKNQWLKIDGKNYYFDSKGYLDESITNGTSKVDAMKYSYEIIPMLSPFNEYFYIKTDNPDPESFSFVDRDTKYSDSKGTIEPSTITYSDIKYENESTRRVKGGYIGKGIDIDGGELLLVARNGIGKTPMYNLTTGEITYVTDYDSVETNISIKVDKLVDETDYLINTYGGSASDYFGKMSAIQSGFSSICLYKGASIRGNIVKGETNPYYGISNSPHVDQNFYIQSPYVREDGKRLFVSDLYPFRYDSLGFPSMMISVSERIQPDATYKWNDNSHYLVDFTYKGITRSYGGQGNGGGQSIMQNQVNYWYTFDGTISDAAKRNSLDSISKQLKYYGTLEVPDDIPTSDKLTWSQVRNTVGISGSYVKIIALYNVYGSSGTGYTYLFDNGGTSEQNAFVSIGDFSNAWFEGRYYNRHEIIEKGVRYGDIAADGIDTKTASIVIKDAKIPVPDSEKTYYYDYLKGLPSSYDPEKGIWKGFTKFYYDSLTGNYIAEHYEKLKQYDGGYKSIDNADFIAACTLTPDEVKSMNLDKNTEIDPSVFYIYDMKTAPGSSSKSGN